MSVPAFPMLEVRARDSTHAFVKAAAGVVLVALLAGSAFQAHAAAQAAAPGLSHQGGQFPTSAGSGSSQLGASVALSADGNTAIVGAPEDSDGVGAAFVYTRDGLTWTLQATITAPPDTETGAAKFGTSVAISADGNLIVVGEPLDVDSGITSGGVWVFARDSFDDPEWAPLTHLTPGESLGADGQFGTSVAVSATGDVVLVGAPGAHEQQGRVLLFAGSDGDLTLRRVLAADDQSAGSFGASVALSADGNTAIVGAPTDSAPYTTAGAGTAWVFARHISRGQGTLLTGDLATGGAFGSSVAISADGTTVLVGDPSDRGGNGAAWAFAGAATDWSPPTRLIDAAPDAERFGASVAIDADGGAALIGAPGANAGGSAYPFVHDASWAGAGILASGDAGSARSFGSSVALNANGDTGLVGDPGASGSQGAAWPYSAGPIVSGEAASNVQNRAATLTATIDPNLSDTTYTVEYGTSLDYGQATLEVAIGTEAQSITQTIADLEPGTTYHFRVDATSSLGTTLGSDQVFTTVDDDSPAPVLSMLNITSGHVGDIVTVGGSGFLPSQTPQTLRAIVGGTLVPLRPGSATTSEGALDNAMFAIPLIAAGSYSVEISDGTRTSTSFSSELSVAASPPTITDPSTQNVTDTDATVRATVDPANASTTFVVDYGTTTGYGRETTAATAGAGLGARTVAADLTGLTANTTYHFRIVATNAGGTATGDDATLRTAASPSLNSTATPPAPSATTIPSIALESVRTVNGDSATVVASIDTGGLDTSVRVDYGSSTSYGSSTTATSVPGGSGTVFVSQTIAGLAASQIYHFHFIATNLSGTSSGRDSTVVTTTGGVGPTQNDPAADPGTAALPPPVERVSADVIPYLGTVLVNGKPLLIGEQIPFGATIDTTGGTGVLDTVLNGQEQSMQFAGGVFQLTQPANGLTVLTLQGGDDARCGTTGATKKITRQLLNAKTLRSLWGNGHGQFQVKGRYAAATVRGTIFHVVDRCDGTYVKVRRGVVSITDLKTAKSVTRTVGQHFLVLAHAPKRTSH